MGGNSKRSLLAIATGTIQTIVGVTALAGSLKLLSAPEGSSDFPAEWLANSPFSTYLVPGLVLLIIIGGGNIASALLTAIGGRNRGLVAAMGGLVLIGFISAELWWVGLRTPLQPAYLVLGIVLVVCGRALQKYAPLPAGTAPHAVHPA